MDKILCDSIVTYGADSNYYVYNVTIICANFPILKGRIFTYNEVVKKGILEGNISIEKNHEDLIIGSYAELDFSDERYKVTKLN